MSPPDDCSLSPVRSVWFRPVRCGSMRFDAVRRVVAAHGYLRVSVRSTLATRWLWAALLVFRGAHGEGAGAWRRGAGERARARAGARAAARDSSGGGGRWVHQRVHGCGGRRPFRRRRLLSWFARCCRASCGWWMRRHARSRSARPLRRLTRMARSSTMKRHATPSRAGRATSVRCTNARLSGARSPCALTTTRAKSTCGCASQWVRGYLGEGQRRHAGGRLYRGIERRMAHSAAGGSRCAGRRPLRLDRTLAGRSAQQCRCGWRHFRAGRGRR